MFDGLREKFSTILKRLTGIAVMTDSLLCELTSETKKSLIDADVNREIAEELVNKIAEKVKGKSIPNGLSPGDFFVFSLYEEVKDLLGESEELILKGKPSPVMISGLNGSGKTTTCGKISRFLKENGKSVLLVPCDLKRAAAVEQLRILAQRAGVDFFEPEGYTDPVRVASKGLKFAKSKAYDVAIFDTAGRLHIDKELLKELNKIYNEIEPSEHLLVLDAMTGQEAVRIAAEFKKVVPITGLVFTKVDTDAKGGAILSVRKISGRPIKFLGTGERLDDLEKFFPDRIAKRLLSFGDIEGIIERFAKAVDEKKIKEMEEKVKKADFTLDDLLEHITLLKSMGGLRKILPLLPGSGIPKEEMVLLAEENIKKTEAIILSMTKKERANPDIIDGSRRLRIAKGSGTNVADVNRVLKSYKNLKKIMKRFKKINMLNLTGG
jgi:signal recognition particle subunit SRP54